MRAGITLFGDSLTVSSTGTDDNLSVTNAGSGGLIAGAAAIAKTTQTNVTTAELRDGDARGHSFISLNQGPTGAFAVIADHRALFNDQISAVGGGLFAGAGAEAANVVVTTVSAGLGAGDVVFANNVTMTAKNRVDKPMLTGGETANIKGTTGGLASAAGADDHTTLTLATQVVIGNNAVLEALGQVSNDPILVLEAVNSLQLYDKVVFETGGALAGAVVGASVIATTDRTLVKIGDGAFLQSNGATRILAHGDGNITELLEVNAYGAGTLTVGSAKIIVAPVNEVTVGGGAIVHSHGDLNIAAGGTANRTDDHYAFQARYDGVAGSLIPISSVDAVVNLIQVNNIVISGGVGGGSTAWLRSARDVNLFAGSDATGDSMIAAAKITSWASEIGDALKALFGGATTDRTGHDLAVAYGTVRNDGLVTTGLERFKRLDFNWINGEVQASGDPSITYTLQYRIPGDSHLTEYQFDLQQLATYGKQNAALYNFYTQEVVRLKTSLIAQGLLNPVTLQPTQTPVLALVVDPVTVYAGPINVFSGQVTGSGSWSAPGDARVEINNNTPLPIQLRGIQIPDSTGGLYVNNQFIPGNRGKKNEFVPGNSGNDLIFAQNVRNAAAVNLINSGNPIIGLSSNFDLSQTPNAIASATSVSVVNRFNAAFAGYPWPSITVLGTSEGGIGIRNIQGNVTLSAVDPVTNPNSKGDIFIHGPINAASTTITAGGSLFITRDRNSPDRAFSIRDPDGLARNYGTLGATHGKIPHDPSNRDYPGVGPADQLWLNSLRTTFTTEGAISADRVFISAPFINVDGLIVSGHQDYSLTMGTATSNEIAFALLRGMTGRISLATATNADFAAYYDTDTGRIVVQDMRVTGGFVSLTGTVVNTGGGEIRVMGAYGNVQIENTTGYELVLNGIDASTTGAGTLIIVDKGRGDFLGNPYATVYQSTATGVRITQGIGNAISSSHVNSRSLQYAPASNARWGWSYYSTDTVQKFVTVTKESLFGFINWQSAPATSFLVTRSVSRAIRIYSVATAPPAVYVANLSSWRQHPAALGRKMQPCLFPPRCLRHR